MNRNSIRSLQGLDKSMSMSMMTAGIESATESGSDDWVLEVINKLESETGVAIPQSVAMKIGKTSKSSYSGSAKSGKSSTKSPTEGPTAVSFVMPTYIAYAIVMVH